MLRPTILDAGGNQLRSQPVHCHIVCIGFYADGPARVALMNAMSMNSYLGCFCCLMPQVSLGRSWTAFMGYSRPVTICRGFLEGTAQQMVRS